MLRRRRVGWVGLTAWYVIVAVVLGALFAASSSNGLQFGALIVLILVGPTAAAPVLKRREPAGVVALVVAVLVAVLIGLTAIVEAVSSALAVHGGRALEMWLVMVPAIVASAEVGRRVKRRGRANPSTVA